MHTYAMRGCSREHHVFYISLVAVIVLALVNQVAGYFGVAVSVTTVAIFGAIFFAFDRWAWRQPGVSLFVGIPNLSGQWEVTGKTDGADGQMREWSGQVRIVQTWSRIAICIETETSRSRSGMASVEKDAGHGFRVLYGYGNEPKETTSELRSHRGTCEVVFSPNLESAEATYFNDHQRRTCGTMKWKRITTMESNNARI